MENIFIVLIAMLIMISIIYFIRYRSNNSITYEKANNQKNEMIKIETYPLDTNFDENSLVEIKDDKVLARIDNIIPHAGKMANDVNKVIDDNKEVLYRVIIPKGEKLVDSKNMKGAVRAFYKNSKGIKGHADLVAVKQGTTSVATVASSTMNVASMVVGQYYMSQINGELSEINGNIDKISDFQNAEYKSKIMAVSSQLKKISSYKLEILENEELRRDEIQNINRLEQECLELLGQANLTIEKYYKKIINSYNEYQNEITGAQNWYLYQNILLDLLYKIADLKHALYLGEVSIDNCNAYLSSCTEQVVQTQKKLAMWHENTAALLNIQIESKRVRRSGFDAVLYFVPGLFKDDYKFKPISDRTIKMINTQTKQMESNSNKQQKDLYDADVELIFKSGKVYYLLEGENKKQE